MKCVICNRFIVYFLSICIQSTGLTYFPSLVSYYQRSRLIGEEALPQILSENTVQYLQTLQGKFAEIEGTETMHHAKLGVTSDSQGRVVVRAVYCDEEIALPARAVLATFMAKLSSRITSLFGPGVHLAVTVPPNASTVMKQACLDACAIAGIDTSIVSTVAADDALVSCYSRKLGAIRAVDRELLAGKVLK